MATCSACAALKARLEAAVDEAVAEIERGGGPASGDARVAGPTAVVHALHATPALFALGLEVAPAQLDILQRAL